MELTADRCEVELALRYAFWEYPAARALIDETCSQDGDLHELLESECEGGAGESVTPHRYWVCQGHVLLLPILDEVITLHGDTPLTLALTEE
jgi:hypothetical protein